MTYNDWSRNQAEAWIAQQKQASRYDNRDGSLFITTKTGVVKALSGATLHLINGEVRPLVEAPL